MSNANAHFKQAQRKRMQAVKQAARERQSTLFQDVPSEAVKLKMSTTDFLKGRDDFSTED